MTADNHTCPTCDSHLTGPIHNVKPYKAGPGPLPPQTGEQTTTCPNGHELHRYRYPTGDYLPWKQRR